MKFGSGVWEKEENLAKLGTMPDRQLARELGLCQTSISEARRRRNIPVFGRPKEKPIDNGHAVRAIIEALTLYKQLSARELRSKLKMPIDYFAIMRALWRIRKPTKRLPKRIYIIAWQKEFVGNQYRDFQVYALGDLPDAPKPKNKSRVEIHTAYRKRVKHRIAQKMGVFQLLRESTDGNLEKRV